VSQLTNIGEELGFIRNSSFKICRIGTHEKKIVKFCVETQTFSRKTLFLRFNASFLYTNASKHISFYFPRV
jgi:hypothetical protein